MVPKPLFPWWLLKIINTAECTGCGSNENSSNQLTFSTSIKTPCLLKPEKINTKLYLSSFKNTMSDLGPTNPLFNEKLEAYREQLLPKIIENWGDLSEEEQAAMRDMGHFFLQIAFAGKFCN